jgi:phosphoribosylanthranilate isomerase
MGFIKICGMTDAGAVEAALRAGVEAIGFVFAPSVRQVTPQVAEELARPARGRVLCVAVTQHPDAALIDAILTHFQPDVLQTDVGDLQHLTLPASLTTWPVVRGALHGALPAQRCGGPPLLFEGPRSGAGAVSDWQAARELARHHMLILAGGLNADNIAAAIAQVQPFGVDVSSGVEAQPGRKDPQKIEAFVTRARATFASASKRDH